MVEKKVENNNNIQAPTDQVQQTWPIIRPNIQTDQNLYGS